MITTAARADSWSVGVVFFKAYGTLRISDGEHALLLLLEENWFQDGPLAKQLVQLRLKPRLGCEQRLLPIVECRAMGHQLLDSLHTPELLLHSTNLLFYENGVIGIVFHCRPK
eukprot:CAMPEP_0182823334 /NCGR_PEP_ID=MMETSP0006_2-20121128/14696_1 /TAXON_ID=97485 /ORGANISM="Prymnesium parvum, Strain Texoma1" /LENGTH=112 /DNA_ID=CAMNT_0024950247 /DNA_START=350 /DNA_END=688 /DNA_ORIENTATION=+